MTEKSIQRFKGLSIICEWLMSKSAGMTSIMKSGVELLTNFESIWRLV